MIVKLVPWRGKGTFVKRGRSLAAYIGRPRIQNATEKCVIFRPLNTLSSRPEVAFQEMEENLRRHVWNNEAKTCPYEHWILSWHETEMPLPEEAEKAARTFLAGLGMERHPALYGLHVDTRNMHLHICLSRLDPLTDVLHGEKPFRHLAGHRALCMVEAEGGWRPAPNAIYMWDAELGAPVKKKRKDRDISRTSLPYGSVSPIWAECPRPPEDEEYVVREMGDRRWYLDAGGETAFLWEEGRLWCMDWSLRERVKDMARMSNGGEFHVAATWSFPLKRMLPAGYPSPVEEESVQPPAPHIPPSRFVSERQFRRLRDAALEEGKSLSSAEHTALLALRGMGGERRDMARILERASYFREAAYRERMLDWLWSERGDRALLLTGYRYPDVPVKKEIVSISAHHVPERRPLRFRERRMPGFLRDWEPRTLHAAEWEKSLQRRMLSKKREKGMVFHL